MSELSLIWSGAARWFWLALPLLLLVAWWSYRRTVPALSGPLRWLLTLLRFLALTLILFLLWNPVLQIAHRFQRPPETAIVIDASLSMAFPAAKTDSTRLWLERLTEPLRGTYLTYFAAGDTLVSLGESPPETLSCRQPATDLAQALRQVQAFYGERNLQVVVLLSDGAVNRGVEPARVLLPGVAVYTVGIGDTLAPADALLTRLEVDPVLTLGDTARVQVTVAARNLTGEPGEVRLTLGGETIARRRLLLPAAEFPLHLEFPLAPQRPGRLKLRAALVTDREEETNLNNSLAEFIEIRENRRRVRLIAGAPSFDLEMISLVLNRSREIELETWLLNPGFRIPAAPPADLYILIDLPLPGGDATLYADLAEQWAGQSCFWIPGPAVDRGRLAELAGWPQLDAREDVVTVPAQPARVHPVLGDEPALAVLQLRWRNLPPVLALYPPLEPLPASQSLLTDLTDPARALLVVQSPPGAPRRGWLLVRDTWKWHLQMQGLEPGNSLYADLWLELVRWLTVPRADQPLQVAPAQAIFQENQPVRFDAQVFNSSRQPAAGADLILHIASDSLQENYRLVDHGGGRYGADLGMLPAGDYHYRAGGRRGDYTLPEVTGGFAVEPFSVEYRNPALVPGPLRRLAVVSGGAYLNEAATGWSDQLLFYSQVSETSEQHLLRNKWLLLGVILVLLSLEWFLRKYFHLL